MMAPFYLKSLIIQNFATFKNQTISFRPGFNAIVGETGSGKSLVLDALQLILGGRADKKVVRRETEYSLIEASFKCQDPEIKAFLEREGYPLDDQELVIKRLIYRNGTTKNYVNHLSCTVNFLASFSRRYIDLVGQFENQKLLSENYQLHLLDNFAKILPKVGEYQLKLSRYKEDLASKKVLEDSRSHREQRLDYLNYQLHEIEKLNPSSQDEESLLHKKNMMVNLEKTQKICFQMKDIFEGSEGQSGILANLKLLNSLFAKNPDLFQDQQEKLSQVDDDLHSLFQEIERKLTLELDEDELEGVLDRLDLYQKLKKKFGGSVEAILQTQVDFLREKSQLDELEINLGDIDEKIEQQRKHLYTLADEIHQSRIKAARKLGTDLTQKVRSLKMAGATISLEVVKLDELQESGISKVHFLAETNQGEGKFKIKDIASGGELSRILLGLRQILSAHDSISIFLFDEIDTGIGGETANCIGRALSEVAENGQVIAITHLPQIAQFAEALIMVQKDIQSEDKEKRTESFIREIVGKMIMKEVKAMAQLG